MTVPDQVKAKGEAADKLQQRLINGDPANPDNPGTAPADPPEKGTVPAEPPLDPVDPGNAPPKVEDPPAPPADELGHKLRSLEGRIKVQTDQMKEMKVQNDLLYRQISELNRQKVELERQLEEAKALVTTNDPPGKTEKSEIKTLDVDLFAKYGNEFGEMANILNSVLENQKKTPPQPTNAPPTDPAAGQQPPTPGTGNPVPIEMFKQSVTNDVYATHSIDYNVIDASAEFETWLNQFDSMTGAQHLSVWHEGIQVRDKASCLRVIDNFLGSPTGQAFKAKLAKPADPAPVPNAQPDIPPGGGDPAAAAQNPAGRGEMWNSSKVTEFYTAKAKGRWPEQPTANWPQKHGIITPEESALIENDMFAAQTDGRFQG